jgi:hypothetical protein
MENLTRPSKNYHDFWVQNNCFSIQGSPYILQVVDTNDHDISFATC